MTFCGSCSKQAGPDDRFCTSCGTALESASMQEIESETVGQETLDEVEVSAQESYSEPRSAPTTKFLGNKLEDTVEEIYAADGYTTKTRQKLKGRSGSYNEIDVLATRDRTQLAIECKNYSENNKVGIKDVRDFLGKLEDLNIKHGVFVTSSYFSEEAMNLARNNPHDRKIEMWNYNDLNRRIMRLNLGRNVGSKQRKMFKIEDSLPLNTTVSDQSIIHLTNRDRVDIRRCELIFYPICLVSYNLSEEHKAPDREIHTVSDDGMYFADGVSGDIIDNDDAGGINEHMVEDLKEFDSQTVEVLEEPDYKIIKREQGFDRKDVEFKVKNSVIKDNKTEIRYDVRVGRNEYKTRKYTHVPRDASVRCNTRVTYVPILKIEFASKEHVYDRTIMMASSIVVDDEISVCKHLLGNKTTFAVCDVCGVAKCEKDIIQGDGDEFYCKDHTPEEFKPESRSSTISKKLKKFGLRRKQADD